MLGKGRTLPMLQDAVSTAVSTAVPTSFPQKAVKPNNGALNKSVAHFARVSGPDLLARTEPYFKWHAARTEADVCPYSRALAAAPGASTQALNEQGDREIGINFASQDYLSLSAHPAIIDAGMRALRDFGPHSAGSPMLMGNTTLSIELEAALASMLETEHVALFPSGWGAGFGVIAALVRPDDHVIIDSLAHGCLQQGADAATNNVVRHEHLDLDAIESHLRAIRARDARNAVLVVTEGLFSMNSDGPDIRRLQNLCRDLGATLMVDVAHDLGSLGPGGGGQLAVQNMLGKVDLVMGAFSKSFASNGGFVATHSPAVRQYIKVYGGPHIFSNALSPVQAAIVLEAVRIARSAEGDALRASLMRAVNNLRSAFLMHGIRCMGTPSAIVPVPIGTEKLARVASKILFRRGVFANLVEFPAVAVGSARYRMQVMANHTDEQIRFAACQVIGSIHEAEEILAGSDPLYAVVRQIPQAVHGG